MLDREKTPTGCRVLNVEDEWLLATDLQAALKSFGADVIALVCNFDDARVQLVRGGFDVGIIDINLRGHSALDLADELQRQGIPFVFSTGYSAEVIPARFASVARWEKPYDPNKLARYVSQLHQRRSSEAKPKRPLHLDECTRQYEGEDMEDRAAAQSTPTGLKDRPGTYFADARVLSTN